MIHFPTPTTATLLFLTLDAASRARLLDSRRLTLAFSKAWFNSTPTLLRKEAKAASLSAGRGLPTGAGATAAKLPVPPVGHSQATGGGTIQLPGSKTRQSSLGMYRLLEIATRCPWRPDRSHSPEFSIRPMTPMMMVVGLSHARNPQNWAPDVVFVAKVRTTQNHMHGLRCAHMVDENKLSATHSFTCPPREAGLLPRRGDRRDAEGSGGKGDPSVVCSR